MAKPVFEQIYTPETQSFFIEEVSKKHFPDVWHYHPEIEILYVVEGYGTKYIGDSITRFWPGEIVVVGANTPHVWRCSSRYLDMNNEVHTKVVCIQFKEDFLCTIKNAPEFHQITAFLSNSKRGIKILHKRNDNLIKHLETLNSLSGMKKLIGLLTILDIISNIKEIEFLASPNYKPLIINNSDKDRMETIYNFVIQNFSNKISLNEISSLVNLTPNAFCRFFKSRATKAFSTYVNEVRIGNACKMLIENRLSISEISYKSGFNYLSNFHRQFKKFKGLSPSDFQKKYRNEKFLY